MVRDTPSRFEHQHGHNHQLVLYDTAEEQFAAAAPFIKEGLDAGEQCLYFFHDNTPDEVSTELKKRGINVDAARESNQLSFEDATAAYLIDGDFKPDAMIESAEERVSNAVAAGYNRLRIVGEMSWVTEYEIDISTLHEHEKNVDALFPTEHYMGQCQYHRSELSPDVLSTLIHTHPKIAFTGDFNLNCYYRRPEEQEQGADGETIARKLQTISTQNQISALLDERERWLSLLGQLTGQLQEAAPDEVEGIASDVMAKIIDPEFVSFYRYDRVDGQLHTTILHDDLCVSTAPILDNVYDRCWEAFVANDTQEFPIDVDPEMAGIILPTGQHGVFFVITPRTNKMTETDLHFLQAVTGQTTAALDQMVYEQQLEAKNSELRTQYRNLERVNTVNTVVRRVNQSLVEATTVPEVIETVCEHFVQEACADFAWYGSAEPAKETLQHTYSAGDNQGYLEAITLRDDWIDIEPSGRALRDQESITVQQIYDGPTTAHWQEQALKRGFQSMLSLPVCYDESMYGVLSLYSTIPNTFDEDVVQVLEELSNSIAYAINGIQRKQALVTEETVELKIRITDTELPLVEFVDEHECRVTVGDFMASADSGFRMFATFHGATLDVIHEFAVESPTIDAITLLSEGERNLTVDCRVTENSMIAKLLKHNAVPRRICAEDGEAYLVIRLRQSYHVRSFLETFRSWYPSAEVVARQNLMGSLHHAADFRTQLNRTLTERQWEILKFAYQSQYFERPRGRTAEELAEELGVSRSTVSRHLRKAEQRAFSLIFESP